MKHTLLLLLFSYAAWGQSNDIRVSYNYDGAEQYFKLKEYEKAIKFYTLAIKYNPKYTAAYHRRGEYKYILGKYDEALLDYNWAIILNPNYTQSYFYRGLVKLKLGDKEGACLDLQKALALGSMEVNENRNRMVQDNINKYCK
jgi:tetratricopeptide (TPR) repeat protein